MRRSICGPVLSRVNTNLSPLQRQEGAELVLLDGAVAIGVNVVEGASGEGQLLLRECQIGQPHPGTRDLRRR